MKLTLELDENTFSDIQHNLDPFSELFNNVLLKICWVFLAFGILIFSNPYYFLVILYEKHGEDSMKRSLYNQLISQASYPIILHNLVCASHCKPLQSDCNLTRVMHPIALNQTICNYGLCKDYSKVHFC